VIEEEGFHLHPDKLRTLGKGRRHDVTGLTVNERLSVPRDDVRNFKALLHRMEKSGPAGCTWRGCGDRILARVGGFANYLMMVDAERHVNLHKRAMALLKRHGFQPEIRHPAKRQTTSSSATPPALPASAGAPGLWSKIRRWFGGR
jgi:hypothetical protein